MRRPRVVVTGLGVVSSVGLGWQAFWDSLLAGRSGISEIQYIDTSAYSTHVGGEVSNFRPEQFIRSELVRKLGRGAQFAITATGMALKDAGLLGSPARIGICLGTTMADVQELERINELLVANDDERQVSGAPFARYPGFAMSANVATYFGLTGPNIMIPNACAAGSYALGYAFDLLRLERVDVIIAGGAEPFSRTVFEGFSRIMAVAPERCQPFDLHRKGMIPGEGAGVFVLERYDDVRARGASPYAEILGYSLSCDAMHMTIPSVEGIVAVMKRALQSTGVTPDDIDYINAHGTGTPANDRAECLAIRQVFGSKADDLPVSSVKSMIGHAMGSASALETIACVLSARYGRIPPTINFETPDPECDIDCVPNHSRERRIKIALKNAFAFGGNNASVVIGSCGAV